ncbi:MAG: hypothetical protein ABS62_05115 [Microbacterium sp. SCN 70-200]|mgnify:CR=1 FL=1|uniref:hypothetical protein n=1 Tax=unclassified Microbacterium TaxID=2609290 RepID=UPI00086ECD4D|nr:MULTISPECIES: hypothetical protein [unclassified Microbacterium]MBN9215971.1 hypothetical protein [Microbacterium sp.]ODT41838.1 MAG: hypothetical protein ABS62_05115 [Microbacterium sp. SCN 70-200]OJV84527.1 MAG: hypothetical protein BGO46_06360 [Microbacterium sp. 70-16]
MSTPQNRLTPAPVRQDAICMCATGHACSSFAPGHAVHLIQARLVSATPSEWVDAIVTTTDAADGGILVHTLDGDAIALWNGAGAAAEVVPGTPVAYHPRYHVLSIGGQLFNSLAL